MSEILITGSAGQLGNEISKLSVNYPQHHFIFTDVKELNIAKKRDVENFFNQRKIDFIVNCAAYTAVDLAEKEKELSTLINSTAVKNLAQISAQFNATLIHISTDYVFDGRNYKPYNEDDPTNPISWYGKTKLEGEIQLNNFAKDALIIRTSWLYSEFGKNFVKTIIRYAQERDFLNVVSDQVGTPTYANDLASTILQIISNYKKNYLTQTYHFSNEGVISWYDFAKAIVELKKIECIINPIETKDFPTPAARPIYGVLNKAKIKTNYGLLIPYWRDSLIDCLNKMDFEN
ncbi:MAG: dTDP-4-dehydrorhamnose reductase [Bacteroidales bacterium]|nr:dTDP-4-dehydrorhamnose reductase [Bacteroidales bacterium]